MSDFISEFEKNAGLPAGCVVETIVKSGGRGAWGRMERGEFPSSQLSQYLSAEIADIVCQCVLMYYEVNILCYE